MLDETELELMHPAS